MRGGVGRVGFVIVGGGGNEVGGFCPLVEEAEAGEVEGVGAGVGY